MGDLRRDFSKREFACRCCGKVFVATALADGLQALRDLAGRPVIITSGYRCARHNNAVGGADGSLHTSGQAADIVVGGLAVHQMYALAEQIPVFGGIGVYDDGFLHVDVRPKRARWGRVGGRYVSLELALAQIGQGRA